jgi:hypothetical protein
MPLLDRKKRLVRLLGGRRLGIVLSDHTEEDGATIFRQPASWARVIVSKRLPALQMARRGIGSKSRTRTVRR